MERSTGHVLARWISCTVTIVSHIMGSLDIVGRIKRPKQKHPKHSIKATVLHGSSTTTEHGPYPHHGPLRRRPINSLIAESTSANHVRSYCPRLLGHMRQLICAAQGRRGPVAVGGNCLRNVEWGLGWFGQALGSYSARHSAIRDPLDTTDRTEVALPWRSSWTIFLACRARS
jgi:hypothetical protein